MLDRRRAYARNILIIEEHHHPADISIHVTGIQEEEKSWKIVDWNRPPS